MAEGDKLTVVISLPNDWKRISVPCDGKTTGQVFFKTVMMLLKVEEPIWFSIEVVNKKGKKLWLQAARPLEDQDLDLKKTFKLRVKYYPPSSTLAVRQGSAVTRNLLYLDIQENVLAGRISSPTVQAVQLAAFTMQAVFGDYNPAVHVPGFLDENKEKNRPDLLSRVLPVAVMTRDNGVTSAEWHTRIFTLHQRLKGWSVAKAEAGYVAVSQQLQQYGVSFHEILDTSNLNRMIGISLKGIHFYDKSTEEPPEVSFSWGELDSTYVQGNKFAIQLKDKSMPLITVKMKSKPDATELLDMCIGYHMRFNRVLERQQQLIAQRAQGGASSSSAPAAAAAAPKPTAAAPAASSSSVVPSASEAPPAYSPPANEEEEQKQQESMLAEEEKAEAQILKSDAITKSDGKGTVRIRLGSSAIPVFTETQDDAADLPAGLAAAQKALDTPDSSNKDQFMSTLKRVRAAAKAAEQTFLMFAKMMEENPEEALNYDIDALLK